VLKKNVTKGDLANMVGVRALGYTFSSKSASPLMLNLKEHNRGEQLTCGFMATALYDSLFLLHAS
jgi:hypothetical protein